MCKGLAEYFMTELEKVADLRVEKYGESKEDAMKWVKETVEKFEEQNEKDGYLLPLMATEVVNLVKFRFDNDEPDFNNQQAIIGERYIYPDFRKLAKIDMEKNNISKEESYEKIKKLFSDNFPKDINRENFFSKLDNTFKLIELEI